MPASARMRNVQKNWGEVSWWVMGKRGGGPEAEGIAYLGAAEAEMYDVGHGGGGDGSGRR